jgi:hypothetical protein
MNAISKTGLGDRLNNLAGDVRLIELAVTSALEDNGNEEDRYAIVMA